MVEVLAPCSVALVRRAGALEVHPAGERGRPLLPQRYPRAIAGLPLGEALRRLYEDRDGLDTGRDHRPVVRIEDHLTVAASDGLGGVRPARRRVGTVPTPDGDDHRDS